MSEAQEEDPLLTMSAENLTAYIAQLKKECSLDRSKTSEGCQQILNYCEENVKGDPLVMGIPSKANPFIESSKCALI